MSNTYKEIMKFRVWNPFIESMIYPTTKTINMFLITAEGCLHFNGERLIGTKQGDKECIPLRWTGLKDKNGKEIYEGDMLKQPFGIIFEVIFENCAFKGAYKETRQMLNDLGMIEIIGNIHENPELLEADK